MSIFFITGTDTDAGKTVATSQLLRALAARSLRAIGMKPVASGCAWQNGELISADVHAHQQASNVQAPLSLRNPYRFEPPISPHLAAHAAGVAIDTQHIAHCIQQLEKLADVVLVEGAGGWLAPLNEDETMESLAIDLNARVILVVGMRLGCLNHALLSAQAIKQSGLELAGWIANQIDPAMLNYQENLTYLQQHMPCPMLAEIAHSPQAESGILDEKGLQQLFLA